MALYLVIDSIAGDGRGAVRPCSLRGWRHQAQQAQGTVRVQSAGRIVSGAGLPLVQHLQGARVAGSRTPELAALEMRFRFLFRSS